MPARQKGMPGAACRPHACRDNLQVYHAQFSFSRVFQRRRDKGMSSRTGGSDNTQAAYRPHRLNATSSARTGFRPAVNTLFVEGAVWRLLPVSPCRSSATHHEEKAFLFLCEKRFLPELSPSMFDEEDVLKSTSHYFRYLPYAVCHIFYYYGRFRAGESQK